MVPKSLVVYRVIYRCVKSMRVQVWSLLYLDQQCCRRSQSSLFRCSLNQLDYHVRIWRVCHAERLLSNRYGAQSLEPHVSGRQWCNSADELLSLDPGNVVCFIFIRLYSSLHVYVHCIACNCMFLYVPRWLSSNAWASNPPGRLAQIHLSCVDVP